MKGLEINLTIPDLWQQEAVRALREGRDVIVDAPTGAGKTYVFELLYSELRVPAVFTVPTRALANDKLAEWRRLDWDVGISTGDLAWHLDARVVVATLEAQKHRLIRSHRPGLLVVDEFQMLADPVRGVNYELALALAPPGTQLLLMSGSVANPRDVADWLRRLGRDPVLVSHRERPVPIEEVDLENLRAPAPRQARGFWARTIAQALHLRLGPILVFSPRRQAAEELAGTIAGALPEDPLPLSPEQEALAGPALARLLRQRVAFHHSGLSYALRAGVIEPLGKNGHLRVIVATMGLAAGINFSVRSVLVTGTSYLAGHMPQELRPDELLQMFGRAGRRGFDEMGYVLTTSRHPRLHDARPATLRRAPPIDWPMLLSVMQSAHDGGEDPLAAIAGMSGRFFSHHPLPLGTERSQETGRMPCGLRIDMERARFIRRGQMEMRNSRGEWEPPGEEVESTLGQAKVFLNERWRPLLGRVEALEDLGHGAICRLAGDSGKRYGREVPIGSQDPRQADTMIVAKWLRPHLRLKRLPAAHVPQQIYPRLPGLTGGGRIVELLERGPTLFARLDFSHLPIRAMRDSHGADLIDPPTRRVVPACCEECPERTWCETVSITESPAAAWPTLGLIEADGTPTRRGRLFSYFDRGEGLAVAAALENEDYQVDDLLFDLANLRAGHRFAGDDSPYGGRLGAVCQEKYRRADHRGYLELGVPVQYGAGAAEVVRAIVEQQISRSKLLTEFLRPGDIERVLAEWRSLLRHIVQAPDDAWPRWQELKALARQYAPPAADTPPPLPDLLPAQSQRRFSQAASID